jgi:porin
LGIAALDPGFGYSGKFSTDLSVFNWTQMFADGKAGLSVGRLPFDAFLDQYILTSFTKAFHNRAFIINPTIPTTGTGALGVVMEGFVSEHVRIGGGFFDANAVSGEFDIDTWQRHEFLKYAEVGWSPSFGRYKSDKIQFTYWEIDEQIERGVPAGSGWALTGSLLKDDIYLLFFRAGHSDGGGGAPAEDAVSLGIDWRHQPNQVFSVGLGWAQPSQKTHGQKLADEYVLEMSYGLRLTQQFSLLPDIQLIKDPALNPDESWVWVVGLRARFVF